MLYYIILGRLREGDPGGEVQGRGNSYSYSYR